MAHVLRGYGQAREGAYFKHEQEADLQRHRTRLVKEGRLSEEEAEQANAAHRQRQQASLEECAQQFEVLGEIHAQQARVVDPQAARRQEFERRIRGEPPPLDHAEMLRYRAAALGAGGGIYALGSSVGHVPRMTMGRGRYQVPQAPSAAEGLGDWTLGPRQMSPEAREAARRAFLASLRSLVYGSLLGAVGLAAAATIAVSALDIHSGEDLRQRVRAGFAPLSASIQSWLLPIRTRAERWAGPAGGGGSGGEGQTARQQGLLSGSEFQRRLKERYTQHKVVGTGAAAAHQDGAGTPDL